MPPGPDVADPTQTTVPVVAGASPGPVAAPGGRAPVATALRGTDPETRVKDLWDFSNDAADHAERAQWRRAALIIRFSARPGMTEAELDVLVDKAIDTSQVEPLSYTVFGEPRFLQYTELFPNMWASRVEQALLLPVDEAVARKEAFDSLRDLENVSALIPPHVVKYGLPLTLDRARTIQAFRLAPADVKHDHITQPYIKAAYKYMGRRVLASQVTVWNGIARATSDEIEAGRKVVSVADLTDFEKRAATIIAGVPDRLRMTSWDDPALRLFEQDILSLRDVVLLQGFGAGLAGLTGILGGWTVAADKFSERLREVNPQIRGAGKDNAWRALSWAYQWGYYGTRAAEIWEGIKKHGLTIVLTAVGFVVVQFIPGLNIVVDVAVIIYSGIDALLALEAIISAFKAAWDASTLFQLERGTARVADALVGDGFRLIMDLIGLAAGIGGLMHRAARLKALNKNLSEEQAARQALEEAAGKVTRRVTPAEEFLARHGNSELARQAIRAAGGNANDAAVVLRLLQGTRPTAADLALLQRIAPSMYELGLATDAAFAAGLNPVRIVNYLRDPAVAVVTRTAVSRGLRRIMGAGLTDAEMAQILAHFNRADDLALAMRALDDVAAVPAGSRDVLHWAAQEGRSAADLVRALRGAAPTALATAAERLAQFLRSWIGGIGFRQGNTATTVTEVVVQTTRGPRRIRISEYDFNHYRQGHTWERFSFHVDNINRAGRSTFWPPGTLDDTIHLHARLALHNAAPEIEAAILAPPANGWLPIGRDITVGGIRYRVGIDWANGRLTQFYPRDGAGVIAITRQELHQIRAAMQNAGRAI